MRLRKKIFIGFLCIVVFSQIPFFLNRWHTGNLSAQIADLNQKRLKTSTHSEYSDYKGIIHVHSFLGGHSTGTFDELISGAEQNKLDFVVMTEHVSDFYDTSAMTLRDKRKNILFLGGNETSVKDGNRFLVVDSFPELSKTNKLATTDFLNEVHAKDHLAFVTYPENFTAWDSEIDGIEVFSLHTNAKTMNPASFIFDSLWSYRKYPELTLAQYFQRPDKNLAKFDALSKRRDITLFAGSDAHSNLGLHFGDDSDNKYIDLKFDRYETIFRLVRTHVLIKNNERFEKESLLAALRFGNSFIGVDILSDSSGFSFEAANGDEKRIQGDEINLNKGVRLSARAPQISRFVLFRDGEKIKESGQTSELNFDAKNPGIYRVEVYLDVLGSPFDKMPWIMSNPIYVR